MLLLRRSHRRIAAMFSRRAVWAALYGITFVFYFNATLNHFYDHGASTDAAWFAGMIWQTDFTLPSPLFQGDGRGSFYMTHFSPALVVPMALSHLIAYVPTIPYFATTVAIFHLISTGVFAWIALRAVRMLRLRGVPLHICALSLTALFAFCNLQTSHIGLPHFEILQVGVLTTFLYLLLRAHFRLALVVLFVAFTVREDAGLIVASFLAPYMLWQWREKQCWKTTAIFLVIAVLVSACLMFYVLPHVFHGPSLFQQHYVGQPPFDHLTAEHFRERTDFLLTQNNHVWFPLAAMLVFAVACGEGVLAVGAIGAVPWILFQTYMCRHYTGGTLSYYYNYPVLIALAWPLIAVASGQVRQINFPERPIRYLVGFACVTALGSTATLSDIRGGQLVRGFVNIPYRVAHDARQVKTYEFFFHDYEMSRTELGSVWATMHAIALSPNNFRRNEWLFSIAGPERKELQRLKNVDTILVMDRIWGCEEFDSFDRRNYQTYRVQGTRLKLLRKRDLTIPVRLVAHLKPIDSINGPLCSV